MAEQDQGGLSASEEAYFESGGEAELDTPETEQEQEHGEGQEGLQAEAEGLGEKAPRDEKGRFVPHQALHAEREEHKKTRSELNDMRERWARIEERMNWADQARQQQEYEAQQAAQQQEQPPDPNVDIFAHAQWQQRQLNAMQEQLAAANQANQQALYQQQQQDMARQAEQKVWDYWEQDAKSYSEQNADFKGAAEWLSEFRGNQLRALGAVNPQFRNDKAIVAQIESELRDIVIAAAQQQMSPAEMVYELAKGYGYQPQAKGAKLPGNLANVDKAQQASRTVGQASGRAGGDQMGLEDILAMPRGDFDRWIADPKNERLFDRLMGG